MGVIVDTSILVRAERERNSEWRSVLPSDEDVAVSTITISEITVGLHFAASPAIVARRRAFIDHVLQTMRAIDFDSRVAEVHARIWAEQKRKGKMLGPHDLIIAATAVSLGWDVLTYNSAEFGQIDGLGVKTPY
ncbi:MAG: PIN domain-containing protein [Aestuariivirga sp.]